MKKNAKLDVVMFNMSSFSEWEEGISNRNYHIINQLRYNERINKILSIDYLPHTYRRALRNFKENILESNEYEVVEKNLWSKTLRVDQKFYVYSSVASKFSLPTFYSNLKQTLKKLNFNDYIAWSYYPLETGYFSNQLKPKLKIFDMVDNWLHHPGYKKFQQQLKTNYGLIDDKADAIFTVAEESEGLFAHKEKVHWIPNGVDLKHYQQEFKIVNRDIGDIPRPIIGYIGTIQERIDLDLLIYLARSNPKKSLVLVGPVWLDEVYDKLSEFPNVYILGRKTYQEAPMYIQQFDVGIIPHRLDKFIQSTNPMKIYDYLACGKPVVTTKGAGVEIFSDIVYIANEFQKFNELVNKAIAEDSVQLAGQRMELMKNHSWLKRVERMLEIINQKLQ